MIIIHIITTLESGGAQRILETCIKRRGNFISKVIVICLSRRGSFDKKLRNLNISRIGYVLEPSTWGSVLNAIIEMLCSRKSTMVHAWMYHSIIIGWIVSKLFTVKLVGSIPCKSKYKR